MNGGLPRDGWTDGLEGEGRKNSHIKKEYHFYDLPFWQLREERKRNKRIQGRIIASIIVIFEKCLSPSCICMAFTRTKRPNVDEVAFEVMNFSRPYMVSC